MQRPFLRRVCACIGRNTKESPVRSTVGCGRGGERKGDCMAVVHPHGLLGELGVQFWKSQTEMPFATSKASVQ